ncbi:MAG: LysM domain protein, partial [Firmicutes bacterium]|nr:LysM domain protein [Bacillota bacterium]
MDSLKVQLQGRDIKRINRVRTFAEQNLLVPKHLLLGVAEADQVTPARFNTTAVTAWQSAAPVTLPYGQPADKNLPVPLRIWSLPDNLIDLAVPQRDVVPRFAFKVGTYDQATGKMATRPVGYYGWGMQIGLAIKRIPPVAGSPATAHTYELVAANEYDIVLLERLLAAISPTNHGVVSDLTLLYLPSPVGQAAQGKQSDGNGNVAFFLTQVNLSTDTHPPALMLALRAAAPADDPPTGCYNTAYDFIRLLWEGSITRSGGYFLYYHNFETQEGLPDRVFNDKGEAELTLLVSFRPHTDTDRNRAMSFMNCVITGDISDTPRGDSGEQQAGAAASFTVFAETDPEQRTASPGGSSLDDLAIAYYADAISIGEQNADLPLRVGTVGTTLTVASGVYQVGVGAPGADLATIAQYFGTSVQAIQAANPRIADWSGLKLSDALRLPALQVPVKAGDSLRKLASFYGEELAALVAENRTVMGLFPDAPPLQVTTGPSVRSALVPPGVVEAKAQRDQPGAVPRNPDDPVFAETYLQNMFHMLGYRVGENQDFTSSDSGLPVGPADPVPEEELGDKARLPAANADGAWQYDRAVPYYKFALPAQARAGDLPPLADNPYRGVGDLLQLDFGWQDIFGNQILTPLDSPTPGSPVNRPPILLGYTDTLLGPGQWPSVGLSYQVLPGTAAVAGLQFAFTFDTQPYESGKETNDDQGPTWQQAAAGDLSTYRRLYYQLNQVLNKQDAVTYTWHTSLLPGDA